MNISILGAGAWGTALAVALAPRQSVMLWARGAAAGQTLAVGVVPADAKAGDKPALPMQTLRLRAGRHCLFTLPSFAPEAAGQYRLRLEAVLGPGRGHVDVDDVEVACAA